MAKNTKSAVVVSNEIPANEVEVMTIESVVESLDTPVVARKKRRHARKTKASQINIVHVAKNVSTSENTSGNVTTRVSTTTTVYTTLTTIESKSSKEFTLKLATFFAQNPSDIQTSDIIYRKVPIAK